MDQIISNDVERIMIGEAEIHRRVKEVAEKLEAIYRDRNPVVVCVLKGSVIFFSDLVRYMKGKMEFDFICVSSYGSGTTSSGELKIIQDLRTDIRDRDVLIVEDIIDSGNTLYKLKKMLIARKPASLNIVTLLDKPDRRTAPIEPDYTCFVIEDEFVIGYGLDYAEQYRNLPYVGVLKRCVYEK